MKFRFPKIFVLTFAIFFFSVCFFNIYHTTAFADNTLKSAVYIGIKDYNKNPAIKSDTFVHRFFVDGVEKNFVIEKNPDYVVQNTLAEGYIFDIGIQNKKIVSAVESVASAKGIVTSIENGEIIINGQNYKSKPAYKISSKAGGSIVTPAKISTGDFVKIFENKIFITKEEKAGKIPVSGISGKRTVKNFLKTAMTPVGNTLYIYGGHWNWQDKGSSNYAMQVGLSQKVVDFFNSKDTNYNYKNDNSKGQSYFPYQKYNQYYFAGMDCSGYIGWSLYNTLYVQGKKSSYVESSNTLAYNLSTKYKFGNFSRKFKMSDFKAGDIFSCNGHIWICLGTCSDGSLVIIHSTPSKSHSGSYGGGVQISAIGNDKNCKAYALAKQYMQTYYPQWSERYPVLLCSSSVYMSTPKNTNGKFSWASSIMSDPEGYATMNAEEILADLFSEV